MVKSVDTLLLGSNARASRLDDSNKLRFLKPIEIPRKQNRWNKSASFLLSPPSCEIGSLCLNRKGVR
ncbi:unnamed protein product [Lactuca virosa]|uniref:Uncharacterized protein n=1 Tax=Lactuca virosa TaxID=75947 RepID=A0AAU9NK39_9ASTR|nr:unnamed protein product [Lactuca virosa]